MKIPVSDDNYGTTGFQFLRFSDLPSAKVVRARHIEIIKFFIL